MNPAQPPEGILDPQQPWWPADKVGQATWLRLKGKLTGRRVEGISENFTSYVKLGDADADRLIENIKKYGQYPTVNQNDKYGGAYNNEAYQKWLVEEFLEKPFRQQVNEKIETKQAVSSLPTPTLKVTKKKEKTLENIAQTFKGKVAAQGQVVSTGEKIDKSFLEKEVVPVIEPAVEKETKKQENEVLKQVEKSKDVQDAIKEPTSKSPKADDAAIEKIIQSGSTLISKDIQKLNVSVDTLISIQNANLQASEKMVKSLSDIKSILLGQVAQEKEQLSAAKLAKTESALEGSNSQFGSEAYTDTFDLVPGDEEEQGEQQGKGLFGQVVDAVDFADDIFDISRKFGGKKRKGLRGNRAYGKFRRSRPGRFLGSRFNIPRGIRSRKKLSGGGFLNTPYPSMSGGGMFPGTPIPGGQPVMIGEAGTEIVTPPKLAAGGLKAGVYDNPTKGNLLPGQAVIPLNRTVGNDMFGGKGGIKKEGEGFGLAQPLADAMTMPFKAAGGALFGIAASFLPVLGPFAGILKPFLSLIVRPLGKILGVPTQILDAALGSTGKEEFPLGKILSGLGKTFGIGDGKKEEDDDTPSAKTKGDTSGSTTPGKVIQGGNADFWSLAAVSSLEGINPQGEADVAQAVYNRVASGVFSVKTIKDAVLSPGQFQPVTGDGADLNKWKAITDRESAIAAVATHKGKGTATATKYVDEGAASITNKQLQKGAAEWVGGRTDFAVPSAANKYPGGFGYRTRHGHLFGWYVGPGAISYGKKNPGPAKVPAFPVKAESGTNSNSGGDTSSYMIKGPNSGYPIKITTNDGSTTDVIAHGKESVHVGDSGFSILPHENNQWSVSGNPFETFSQWNKVLTSTPAKEGNQYKAASGITVNDRPWNSGIPLVDLKTKGGKSFQVAEALAPRFKGFVGDLEGTGYRIKEIGGWRKAGSGGGSGPPDPDYDKGRYHHPYGASIDINPAQNPYRPDGKLITDFPSNINQIAKKWGLGWGGNWSSSKDTMHFSVGKSEGGVGYDMKPGGELWQGNPINPGAEESSTIASSDSSQQETPTDPMEALKQNLTDITKNISTLQGVFAGKTYEEALSGATGIDFMKGETTPVATDTPDPAQSANQAVVVATTAQTQPQVVPVPAGGTAPAPSVAVASETALEQMQKIHLSRIG